MTRFSLALLVLALGAPATAAYAQQPAFDLSVRNIMRGPELYGRAPAQVRWTIDGEWIYFRWLEPGAPWNAELKPYRVSTRGRNAPEAITESQADSAAPWFTDGPRSLDWSRRVLVHNGDIWVQTLEGRRLTVRRVTQTAAAETAPRFSFDASAVYFVREGNAYSIDLSTGFTRQLTDIRSGTAPRAPEAPRGQRGAIASQQRELLEFVREEIRADSLRRAEREAAAARTLPIVWIPQAERIGGISLAPDAQFALVSTFIPATGTKGSDVPDYVTVDGYPRMIPGRTMVGDAQGTTKLSHVNLVTGKLTPLTLSPDSVPAGQVNVFGWSDDARHALIAVVSSDFKNRYLYTVNAADGALTRVDALRDEAWVNGPCFNCTGWLPDGRIYFVSEATGYAHLYTVRPDGSDRTAITSGNWEVLDVELAPDARNFRLSTSEPSPFTRQAYLVSTNGGPRTKVTDGTGGHDIVYSPDGTRYATVYSESNQPPELFLAYVGNDNLQRVTTSTTEEFRRQAWIKPEIVMIPGEDGTPVPARIYRPQQMGAQPNGAGVIFVHGAGYLHNVHNWWSSYSREYMFHHLLASRGYTVLDIDYRGSAGYGRDWRTAIYRHMGGKDLDDHVSGSKYLTANFGINPERVGIYGGSYGGFITLMALFNKAEYFGAGAALRSVTDWAHYNHGYTGRILNLPQDDSTSYRRSSPIFFAEGLQDPLLIAHGMVDTNVQFHDVVQLAQRLIELGKEGWEMAVYPVENHGFVRPSSWTDEYRRILELFDRTIGPNGSKVQR